LSSGLWANTTIYAIAEDLHNVIETNGVGSLVAVGHAARRRKFSFLFFQLIA
jgi:hypothetical protein